MHIKKEQVITKEKDQFELKIQDQNKINLSDKQNFIHTIGLFIQDEEWITIDRIIHFYNPNWV